MPKIISIELIKSFINEKADSLGKNESEANSLLKIKVTTPVELILEPEELEALRKYIEQNKKFESLRIKFPSSLNLAELLTEEIIKDQIPKLQITIKENIQKASSMLEYS